MGGLGQHFLLKIYIALDHTFYKNTILFRVFGCFSKNIIKDLKEQDQGSKAPSTVHSIIINTVYEFMQYSTVAGARASIEL